MVWLSLCGGLLLGLAARGAADPVSDGLILHLDAAAQVKEGGTGPANGTWRNLAGQPDAVAGPGVLHGFRFDTGSGWEGSGAPGDPYALRFDGKTSYVEGPGNLELAEITVEAWARVDGVGCFDGHCLRGATLVSNDFGGGGVALILQPTGGYPLLLHGVTFTPVPADTPPHRWQQVVAALSQGTARVYVNGVLEAALAAPRELQAGHFPGWAVGSARRPNFDRVEADGLVGSLALVRVYHRALSGAEVMANFNADRARFGLTLPEGYGQPVRATPAPRLAGEGPAASAVCLKWDYVLHPVRVHSPGSEGWPYGVRWAFDGYPTSLAQPYVRNYWRAEAPTPQHPAEVTINYQRPVAVTRFVHYFDRFRTPRAWRDVDVLTSDDLETWSLRQSFRDLPPDCPQVLGLGAPVLARSYRLVVKALAPGAPELATQEIETYYGATLGNVAFSPAAPIQGEPVKLQVRVVSPDAALPGATVRLVAPPGALRGKTEAALPDVAAGAATTAEFGVLPQTCGLIPLQLELRAAGSVVDRRPCLLRVGPRLSFSELSPAGTVVAAPGEAVTAKGALRNFGATAARGVKVTWLGNAVELGDLAPGQVKPFSLTSHAAPGYAEGVLSATAQDGAATALRCPVLSPAGGSFRLACTGLETRWDVEGGALRLTATLPGARTPVAAALSVLAGGKLCPLVPVGPAGKAQRLAAAVPGAVLLLEVAAAGENADHPVLHAQVVPDDPAPLTPPFLDLELRLAVDRAQVAFRPHIDWYATQQGPHFPYAANGHHSATRMLCLQTPEATVSLVPDTDNMTWGFTPENQMSVALQIPLTDQQPLGEGAWRPLDEAPREFRLALPVRRGDWWDAYRHVVTRLFHFHQARQWALPLTQMQMLNTRYLLRPEIWSETWQTVRSHPGIDFFYNWYGTTYTLPALYSWYLATDDQAARARAENVLDWLLSVQEKEGPLAGGWFSQYCVEGTPPKLVGRDQAWNRWLMPHAVGGAARTLLWYWLASGRTDGRVLQAARRGCDWLVANQRPDGGWAYAVDLAGKPVSDLSGAGQIWCTWALWTLGECTGEERYRTAARRSRDYFQHTFMDAHRYEGYWEDVSGASGKVNRSWEGYEPAIAVLVFADMGDQALALQAARDAATWSWTRVISTRQYETCYGETTEQSLCGPSQAQSPMIAVGLHRAYELTGDPFWSAFAGAIKAMNFCADPDQAYGMVATGGWDDPTTGVVGPPYDNVRPTVSPNNSRGDEYGRQVWAEWETSQFAWLALEWLVREGNVRAPEHLALDPITLRGTVLGSPGRVKMPEEKCDVAGVEHLDVNWVGYQNDRQYVLLVMNHQEPVSVLVRPHEAHLDVWSRPPRILVGSHGRFHEQPVRRQGLHYLVALPEEGTALLVWDRIK